jgi:glucose/arabinose dehydrogenase
VEPGSKPKVYAKGFTNIVDVKVGPKGGLYVLEIAKKGLLQAFGPGGDFTGRLVHLSPDGKRKVVASEGLVAPTGVAVGPKGGIYVSNFGIFPDQGQVVRIRR